MSSSAQLEGANVKECQEVFFYAQAAHNEAVKQMNAARREVDKLQRRQTALLNATRATRDSEKQKTEVAALLAAKHVTWEGAKEVEKQAFAQMARAEQEWEKARNLVEDSENLFGSSDLSDLDMEVEKESNIPGTGIQDKKRKDVTGLNVAPETKRAKGRDGARVAGGKAQLGSTKAVDANNSVGPDSKQSQGHSATVAEIPTRSAADQDGTAVAPIATALSVGDKQPEVCAVGTPLSVGDPFNAPEMGLSGTDVPNSDIGAAPGSTCNSPPGSPSPSADIMSMVVDPPPPGALQQTAVHGFEQGEHQGDGTHLGAAPSSTCNSPPGSPSPSANIMSMVVDPSPTGALQTAVHGFEQGEHQGDDTQLGAAPGSACNSPPGSPSPSADIVSMVVDPPPTGALQTVAVHGLGEGEHQGDDTQLGAAPGSACNSPPGSPSPSADIVLMVVDPPPTGALQTVAVHGLGEGEHQGNGTHPPMPTRGLTAPKPLYDVDKLQAWLRANPTGAFIDQSKAHSTKSCVGHPPTGTADIVPMLSPETERATGDGLPSSTLSGSAAAPQSQINFGDYVVKTDDDDEENEMALFADLNPNSVIGQIMKNTMSSAVSKVSRMEVKKSVKKGKNAKKPKKNAKAKKEAPGQVQDQSDAPELPEGRVSKGKRTMSGDDDDDNDKDYEEEDEDEDEDDSDGEGGTCRKKRSEDPVQYHARMQRLVEAAVERFMANPRDERKQHIPYGIRKWIRDNAANYPECATKCVELTIHILTTKWGLVKCDYHHYSDKSSKKNDETSTLKPKRNQVGQFGYWACA
ncbi:hypothetical protein MPER_13253 [Moniliophthora perniciosa FA553]|nr:hypothetical protein MPER_13253 [Moniliophthora perniciosa FA553]